MVFNVESIKSKGFIPTDFIEYNKVGTHNFMHKAAISLDVTLDSVRSFRVDEDTWQVFLKPNYQKGFVDVPLLGF